MIRKFFAAFLSLSLIFAIAGCSSDGGQASSEGTVSQESSESSQGESKSGELYEVEMWTYLPSAETTWLCDYLNEWGAENGYHFKSTDYALADLNTQYTLGLGSGDLPDLGMINNCDNLRWNQVGLLADITDKATEWGEIDHFYSSSLGTTTIDDRIYGLPYNSNCLALFYNKTILDQAGVEPPATWDELENVCKAVKDSGAAPYGLTMSMVNTDEGTFQIYPFLHMTGGTVYTMDSEESITAVSFLADLVSNGYISSEAVNWNQADVYQQFVQGNVAMMVNGPWQIPNFDNDAPDLEYGVVKIPTYNGTDKTVLGGEGFSIMKNADLEKLWPAMEYMFSAQTLADWNYNFGRLPTRSDSIPFYSDWENDEVMGVFFQQLNNAEIFGRDVNWAEISTAITTCVQSTVTGQMDPEAACAEAGATISGLQG